jgi:hypothetical protein
LYLSIHLIQARFQTPEAAERAKSLSLPSCDEFDARFIKRNYRSSE